MCVSSIPLRIFVSEVPFRCGVPLRGNLVMLCKRLFIRAPASGWVCGGLSFFIVLVL